MLELLEGSDPEEAFKFLFEPDPDERVDEDPEELSKESPEAVAAEFLQILHSRMAATLDDYPLPRSD
jgi:hypothetical protein